MGQAWARTPHPPWVLPVPPEFPELRAGFSWAAVGLTQLPWAPRRRRPGKWDTSGWPGGKQLARQSPLALSPSHPGLSAAWWGSSPLNKPELLDDEEGSPQAHPPPSPRGPPGSGLDCVTFNHLSTHLVWNSWLQGRTRSSCRASKSLKQTTHLEEGTDCHPHAGLREGSRPSTSPAPSPGKGSLATHLCSAGGGAEHAQRLLRLMAVWVEAVGWKLLDVRFGEASRLGISQPLRQAQQGLQTGRRGVSSGLSWRSPSPHLPGQGSMGPHSSPAPRHPHRDPG